MPTLNAFVQIYMNKKTKIIKITNISLLLCQCFLIRRETYIHICKTVKPF